MQLLDSDTKKKIYLCFFGLIGLFVLTFLFSLATFILVFSVF